MRDDMRWGLLAAVTFWVGCGPVGAEAPEAGPALAEVEQAVSAGGTRWVRRSTGATDAYSADVAVDRDGSAIVVGTYIGGSETFGGRSVPPTAETGSKAFLVKYAQDGSVLWARGYGSTTVLPGPVYPSTSFDSVTVDSERRITVIGTAFPIGPDFGAGPLPAGRFLAQFSASGGFRWARHLPGDGFGFGPTLGVDRSDNLLLVGAIDGTMDFGGGPRTAFPESAFIAKFEADGDYLWDRVFDTEDTSHFEGVAADSDGNLYVSGFFVQTGSFGGATLHAADPDEEAPVVASYSPSGAHRWSKSLGGLEGSARFNGLAVHGNRVVVTGWFNEGFTFDGDAFSAPSTGAGLVVAYTRDGEERWARKLGSFGLEVASDLEDDMTVLGFAEGGQDVGSGPLPASATRYFFVSKMDRVDGTLKWGRGFGASAITGLSLAVSRHGEPVVAGSFWEPINLGTGTLTPSASGRFDVFVLRLSP